MAKETKRRTFPTKYTESVEIGTFEVFTKPSMTEPDNAMSIPEIIARFTRGYGIDVNQHQWESGSAFEGEDPDSFFDDFSSSVPAAPVAPAEPAEPAEVVFATPAAPAAPAAPVEPAEPKQEGS